VPKFIERREGVSVKKDDISSIEQRQPGSMVTMQSGKEFDSTFPYLLLLELVEQSVERDNNEGDIFDRELKDKLNAVMDKQTFHNG